MRILICSAHAYLPELAGGAQSSTHELALALIASGHQVEVLAGLAGRGAVGFRSRVKLKLRTAPYASDSGLGYPVHRVWFPWTAIAEVARRRSLEVVLVQSGLPVRMALAARNAALPTVTYLHNVEFDDHGGDFLAVCDGMFLANSRFTAEAYRSAYGVMAEVIPPLFMAERYQTRVKGRYVAFINPHPKKGVDIAFEIARRSPDIPFRFVEAWTLPPADRHHLNELLRGTPNVKLVKARSDMRTIYRGARMVIAPSRWEETWGRVASEAHLSGIPVIATDCGGFPESVGPGGILIPREDQGNVWVEAVRRVWEDAGLHSGLGAQALAYSKRLELNPEGQLERIVSSLKAAQRLQGSS